MHSENWDDLRYILTVAETGSVLQAAKRLGVNHATVLRHVAAFEERHGAPVFERTAQGYRLLPDRVHVIRAAQDAQAAMAEVGRLASGGRQVFASTVRITSTDTLCTMLLAKFTTHWSAKKRSARVTLLSSNTHLDMIREQAHIVVRPSEKLTKDLTGTVVAQLGFAAYAADIAATDWFGLTGPLSRSVAAQWMRDNVREECLIAAGDSFLTLREMAAVSDGIAVLPCIVGDADPRLIRLPDAMPHLTVPLWIAKHVDAIESQHLGDVREQLQAFLIDHRTRLNG